MGDGAFFNGGRPNVNDRVFSMCDGHPIRVTGSMRVIGPNMSGGSLIVVDCGLVELMGVESVR